MESLSSHQRLSDASDGVPANQRLPVDLTALDRALTLLDALSFAFIRYRKSHIKPRCHRSTTIQKQFKLSAYFLNLDLPERRL